MFSSSVGRAGGRLLICFKRHRWFKSSLQSDFFCSDMSGFNDVIDANCSFCGKLCHSKNSLCNHERMCKMNPNKQKSNLGKFIENGHDAWNKGLTMKTHESVKKARDKWVSRYKNGEFTNGFLNTHLTDEHKKHISDSMKIAHSEGRAHNIGMCRWNNKPSWPEEFFMTVIENEFNNKSYIREYPFDKYSLDFAWVGLKRCIEIDGDQHERFSEYMQRDLCKDAKLKENGWNILRIKWKDMYNDTKKMIAIAKDFIDN